MKKFFTYISIVTLTLLAAGCAKEIAGQEGMTDQVKDVSSEEITVTLSVPENGDTRTALGTKDGSSYPVKWSAGDGDYLSLNGTVASASNKDSDSQYTATFKPAAGLSVYNFLYRGDAGHDNQVTFPSTQNYVADGFDPAAMPMYASSANRSDNVTFSHLGALLRFSVKGSEKITSVTLSAKESLSGTFTIGKTDNLLNGVLTSASTGATLMYSFGNPVQLSNTPFVFYIAIPAGTYEDGITLDIVDNASGHMTLYVMTDADKQTIVAGKVREFSTVTYEPETETNLMVIRDDATFNAFVTTVAGGNKTVNARVEIGSATTLELATATINAFNSIDDYKGTFDGNGKGISGLKKPLFNNLRGWVKNLTLTSTISETSVENYEVGIFARRVTPSSEIDDIAGLQNCTAQGSITYTPSSALSGHPSIGGLVGNNKGGAITGCTNNATVTIGDNDSVNHTENIQPSIGGVVGRTQKGGDLSSHGDISNCTNTGTVSCAEQFGGNIMIGGILGFQVEKAESISGCTNSGTVIVASSCSTTAALHIGGVIGMGKGAIESCTNASDGVVTSEAGSTAGTYFCQGGVVGRLNREADSYSGLSNAGTLHVGGTGTGSASGNGIYAGGVVGRCNEGATITEFTNSGSINCSSVNTSYHTYIGGVVAANSGSCILLENCHSTAGTIIYNGSNPAGNLYIGGVVGYSSKPISSCTSAMTIDVGGEFEGRGGKYYSVGGIVGSMSDPAPITSCLNTGNITYSQQISNSAYSFLGGVAGRAMGNITDSSNGGIVTWSGMNSSQNPFIGGLVGDTANDAAITISGKYSSASATNYGKVEINTSTQTNKYFYVGGVAGRARATVTATNAGQINILQLKCTRMYMGGVVGTNSREMGSGNANLADGDITVSGLNVNSDYLYLGGITGLNSAAVTYATNAGDIITTDGSTCKKSLFVGGMVGRGEANISSCTNSGLVSNGCPQASDGSYLQVGGIVGYNNGSSAISDCTNTGNVTNSGNSKGYLYVGGITSESDSDITNCSNSGNVSNSGAATIAMTDEKVYNLQVGGIAGQASSITLSSCSNSGAISNTGNSGAIIAVGGITGAASGSTFTACTNNNLVESSGTANTSDTYSRIGGIIGWAKDGCDLSASGSNKNINYGNVTDSSDSKDSAFAGVVAYAEGADSDFSNCRNEGTVTIGGSKTYIFTGGIAGAFANSSVLDNTYNSGAITASGATMSKSGYLRCGGIIGGWFKVACVSQTISGCTNTGSITLQPDNFGGEAGSNDSFVGGIAGGGRNDDGECGKALVNCTNSGSITMGSSGSTNSGKLYHRYCIGGIIGFTDVNPTGSKCIANIRFRSTTGTNRVGGIAGEMMIDSIHDVTYKGTVNSNGASGTNYTGGLVGNVGTGEITFNNCTVSGTMRGPNSTTTPAGIFCSNKGGGTGPTINITNCKVGSNTRLQAAASGYYITITSASDITASNVFGHNGTNRNCTAGTNSGNSVVDPSTITL